MCNEFRGVLAYVAATSDVDTNNGSASLDSSQFLLGGTAFFGESGFLAGMAVSTGEIDDTNVDTKTTAFKIGYRFGRAAALQPVLTAGYALLNTSPGSDDEVFSLSVGVEKNLKEFRLEANVFGIQQDDVNSYGVGATGVYYFSRGLGLFVNASFQSGSGDINGADADVDGTTIGAGLEFRPRN